MDVPALPRDVPAAPAALPALRIAGGLVNAGDALQRFTGLRRTRGGWVARCPAHRDRHDSLSLKITDDEKLLVHDFGGCRTEDVVAAVGLTLADLCGDRPPRPPRSPRASTVTPLDEARRDVIREARRQLERLRPWHPVFEAADAVRLTQRLATTVRQTPTSWALLADAAVIESDAFGAEADAHVAAFGRCLW